MKRLLSLLLLIPVLFPGTALAADILCACTGPGTPETCLRIDAVKLTSGQPVSGACTRLPSVVGTSLNGWSCKAEPLTASSRLCETPTDAYAAGSAPSGEAVAPAAGSQTSAGGGPPIIPKLNVDIPGVDLSKARDGASPLLALYLSGAYNYLVAISITAATIMFTWGAFRYLLGSTPAFSVQRGKEIMRGAVIGLLLVLSAVMILRTVNPQTVQLRSLAVDPIQAIAWENEDVLDPTATLNPNASGKPSFARGRFLSYSAEELAGSETIPAEGRVVNQPLTVPMFKQFIGPWATRAYGPAGVNACPGKEDRPFAQVQCCTTFAQAGCGPASLATLLVFEGIAADPETVGTLLSSFGSRICNEGTLFKGSTLDRFSTAANLGTRRVVPLGRNLPGVKSAITVLREGRPVMFLCSGCTGQTSKGQPKSYGGHYMVLTGVDPTGRIFSVSDVGNSGPVEMVNILQDNLAKHSGGFWAVRDR